ncbi:hypothetical protein ACI65C_013830 [Semiaphis heraclei]
MVNLCIVKECNNSSKLTMKKCKMFKMIPKDELRRKNWLINCSRQDLLEKSSEHHVVCSDHFEDKMYSNPDKTVLLPNAVPPNFCSLSPSSSYSADCSISSSTQTTQILSLHTPRKKKYRAELREMKNKYEQLELKMNALSEEVAMKNRANAIDGDEIPIE